jgi:hypothetical protein
MGLVYEPPPDFESWTYRCVQFAHSCRQLSERRLIRQDQIDRRSCADRLDIPKKRCSVFDVIGYACIG